MDVKLQATDAFDATRRIKPHLPGTKVLTFTINGDPTKAEGYFKNINGQIVDTFDITGDTTAAKQRARCSRELG